MADDLRTLEWQEAGPYSMLAFDLDVEKSKNATSDSSLGRFDNQYSCHP